MFPERSGEEKHGCKGADFQAQGPRLRPRPHTVMAAYLSHKWSWSSPPPQPTRSWQACLNPSFKALPLKIGAAREKRQMDSCPLALCIWHTAVRPGRSPGWHEEQTEHPLQRRL